MQLPGIWQYYDAENTPLSLGMRVGALATGPGGQVWVEVVQPLVSDIGVFRYYDAQTKGIMLYDNGNWTLFQLAQMDLPQPMGTVDLACDHAGYLWVHLAPSPGTSVLCRFHGETSTLYQGHDTGLPSDMGTLKGFASDREDRFWAAMGSLGAYYFNGVRWHRFDKADCFPEGGWVSGIASDEANQLWFGLQSKAESLFIQYVDGHCKLITTAPIGYERAQIGALAIDSNGNLWVGWYDWSGKSRLGLWVWSTLAGKWTKYTSRNSAIADDQVSDIAFDSAGRTWVVTAGGLTIIDGKDSVSWGAIVPGIQHRPISQEEASPLMDEAIMKGEPPPFVFIGGKVASDSRGNIWTTSANGVAVFSRTA